MHSLLQSAYTLLASDSRLVSSDGDLLKNKIQELAHKLDEWLVWLLLWDETMRSKFFITIKDVLVFDQSKFVQFISNKEFLPDSYTAYKNKIWLVNARDELIHESWDVVLNRPYKDCVLAWWQDSEDAKRDELFYNEVLWSDDIDRLLDPKVFTKFTKYDKDGSHELNSWTRDEDGTITDNLIIKGNNLLALTSLQREYAGKVKLIYIDPPYNTSKDGFKYNDRFNHSTWLTFMKNRLEQAKTLLKEDGVIFVQCDDNEQAYLKVLMDSIFWREKSLSSIVRKKKVFDNNNQIPQLHEYILVYWTSNNIEFNLLKRSDEQLKKYKNPDNDPRWLYNLEKLTANTQWGRYSKATDFVIRDPSTEKEYESNTKNRRFGKDTIENMIIEGRIDFNWSLPRYRLYLKEIKQWVSVNSRRDDCHHNLHATKELQNLFNFKIFDTPKPEKLLERIIEISTNPWDIVLDYHLWSWTTCAVAHKMWRQYIGVEQMDYIEDVAVARMQKVIEGEQWWISKSVNRAWWWSFVYMETMKHNQHLIDQINTSDDITQLTQIYNSLVSSPWINYRVQLTAVSDTATQRAQLEVSQMKQLLINLIDQNTLYVNYADMRDTSYEVSEQEIKLNDEFYQ